MRLRVLEQDVKAHQRIVRERMQAESASDLLGNPIPDMGTAHISEVGFTTCKRFILQYEWLGTMPSGFKHGFGLYFSGMLGGVVVVGSPNPKQIARSVMGGKMVDAVVQIHRGACAWWAHEHAASFLIGGVLRRLRAMKYAMAVAFADPMAGEIGTVYQATNWLYCGMTAKRPDYFLNGRRLVGNFKVTDEMTKADRPRKHRYAFALTRAARRALAWPVMDYPKRPRPTEEPCTEHSFTPR